MPAPSQMTARRGRSSSVRFHRIPISLSIIRTAYQWGAVPSTVVDDLVQETYLKLCADKCRLLREFAVQHPEAVLGYIKTIAVNVAHDHFKSLHSQKRGSGETDQLLEDVDPACRAAALAAQSAMEREVLLKEIDRPALQNCSEGSDQETGPSYFLALLPARHERQGYSCFAHCGLNRKGCRKPPFFG